MNGTRTQAVLQNGFALREIRRRTPLSVQQLALRLGTDPGTIRNIELERKNASHELLVRIARVLDCPLPAITNRRAADE
jgi:transcriptional regulator with XRE-family HTH domain